jgi:NADH:ubiquinone oxidoreductase subunit K
MPFGVLQVIVILFASWAAYWFKTKSVIFILMMLPVVIGSGLLLGLPHVKQNEGPLLAGYYMLAFLFSANPLILRLVLLVAVFREDKTTDLKGLRQLDSG